MNNSVDAHQKASLSDQPGEKFSPLPDEVVFYPLMPSALESELAQVRTIDLVDKVYCSPDQEMVVVELWRNESLGLKHRNILFFPVEGFVASQAYEAIARLRKTSQSLGRAEPSPTPKGRRKLVL